jgi:Mg2+/Co2+ transporter CorB
MYVFVYVCTFVCMYVCISETLEVEIDACVFLVDCVCTCKPKAHASISTSSVSYVRSNVCVYVCVVLKYICLQVNYITQLHR